MTTKKELIDESNDTVIINIRKVQGKKKDGTDFTAFETIDKNKNRLSVRFTQDCEPTQPKDSCTIALKNFNEDYWVDKRKAFPILRIRKFEYATFERKESENPFKD